MSTGTQFGRFEILERIGSGGMAEIFRAKATGVDGFEKICVIKRILPILSRDDEFISMFISEAKLSAGLQHPNIVQIYELCQIDGQHCIVMEWVPGPDLKKVLRKAHKSGVRVPLPLALHIAREVAKGLQFAHTARGLDRKPLNIIHRDVSPSNIILSDNGSVKIMDFGIAKASIHDHHTRVGTLKGKLGYMSPEQIMTRPVTPATDVFSLGVVLTEVIAGRRLFNRDNELETLLAIRDVNPAEVMRELEIPPSVRPVLERALAREPQDRYSTARALMDGISANLRESGWHVGEEDVQEFLVYVYEGRGEPRLMRESRSQPSAAGVGGHTLTGLRSVSGTGSRPSYQHYHYYLRDPQGRPYGPVNYQNLLRLIRFRNVRAGDPVSVNDENFWRPLTEIPFLTHLFPEESVDSSAPVDRGRFVGCEFIELLLKFGARRERGKLKVSSGSVTKEIFLQAGQPVSVASNLTDELFGSYLIRTRAFDDATIRGALAEQQSSNSDHLGDVLVRRGLLSEEALRRLLSEHMDEKLFEICTWKQASWSYFQNPETRVQHATNRGGSVAERVVAAARSRLTLHQHRGIVAPVLDRRVIDLRPPQVVGIELTPNERAIVRSLKPAMTFRQLLESLGDLEPSEQMAVYTLCTILIWFGLVEFQSLQPPLARERHQPEPAHSPVDSGG
ncbi:MAG: serine/threonine protein kinase [Myxococcales bacterium]|nr:serine/threonine protein kinase [Myxococcales bacterium]